MPAQIDIVNLALIALGEPTLTALTDQKEAARIASALWAPARDEALRAGAWRFAITRSIIAADATAPAWGFVSQYTLPGDCMRVIEIGDYYVGLNMTDYRSGDEAMYRLEGSKILSQGSGALKIRYVSNAVDVGLFDPAFVQVMAYTMARKMAPRLTESVRTKKPDLDGEYALALRNARRADAMERPPEYPADSSWVISRIAD